MDTVAPGIGTPPDETVPTITPVVAGVAVGPGVGVGVAGPGVGVGVAGTGVGVGVTAVVTEAVSDTVLEDPVVLSSSM